MAISCLDIKVQNTIRHPARGKIKQLPQCNSTSYVLYERQIYVLKQLSSKLHKHNLILRHADKRKIIIIVNKVTSRQKIGSFLIENQCQFLFLPRDPTGMYQKQLVKVFIKHHFNRQTQNLVPPANYFHPTKTQSAYQNP
jgi:hypothetical protein